VFIYRLSLEMRKYIIGYFDGQFFGCSTKKKRIDQHSNVTYMTSAASIQRHENNDDWARSLISPDNIHRRSKKRLIE